jgi:shikimate dehydrogenase
MAKTGEKTIKYGLVGRNISYSFSRGYFSRKFADLGLNHISYENYDLEQIEEFPRMLAGNPGLAGLNVTIPYKEAVIVFLDHLDADAAKIGAVNTIKIDMGRLYGFNTDVYGFKTALLPLLQGTDCEALILGTGGASKAVAYVLHALGIPFRLVSRSPRDGQVHYGGISPEIMASHRLIINTTPLGTYPDIDRYPPIPYSMLTPGHILFDLIYNPDKTTFLRAGEKKGCQIQNGLRMLELQAEKSWEIWNS